jgi:hypothetical protein
LILTRILSLPNLLGHLVLSRLFTIAHLGISDINIGIRDKDNWHGTKMMAKVAGRTLGIARRTHVQFTVFPGPEWISEHHIDGLSKMYDEIQGIAGRGGKSTLLIAQSHNPGSEVSDGWIARKGKLSRSQRCRNDMAH